LLVGVLLAGLLPMPVAIAVEAPGGRSTTVHADAAPPEQQPSTAYLEAMAHENDAIEFQPGGLVEVGFTPLAGDRWPIDGRVPRALPPGRATGEQMAASDNGSAWADTKPSDPGDGSGGQDPAASSGPSPTPGTPRATDAPASNDSMPGSTPAASDAPADPPTFLDATPAPIDAPAGDPATPAQGAALAQPAEPAFDLAAASGLRRQVFGFLPYWELSGASTKLNYDVLSTIAYFSVGRRRRATSRRRTRTARAPRGGAAGPAHR
jgi:hypothetical protein